MRAGAHAGHAPAYGTRPRSPATVLRRHADRRTGVVHAGDGFEDFPEPRDGRDIVVVQARVELGDARGAPGKGPVWGP